MQDNINSCVLFPACCGWKEEGDIIVFCIVEIFKRITLHGLEITRRSMVPHHAHPIVPPPPEKKQKKKHSTVSSYYRGHQQAGCISVRLKRWLSTELPSKAAAPSSAWSARLCPFSPARELPGSCTLARRLRSKPSLQRALSNLCQH